MPDGGLVTATFVPVVALDELRDEFVTLREVEGMKLALVRRGDQVYALDGICTHAEFELGPGRLMRGCIECPMHMAQYDPSDGSVLKGPAEEPLETYETRIEDGTVHVAVDWI